MRFSWIVATTLLSSSLLLGQAREGYNQWMPVSNQADTSGYASSSESITVEGCLTNTGYRDFLLTDASGMGYYLNGHRGKLAQMVGQEVRIAGIASPSRNPSTAGAVSAAVSPEGIAPHLTIVSTHKVADTCGNMPHR